MTAPLPAARATSQAAATEPRPRSARLDAARGAAVLAMVVYHSAWDLSQLRLIETDVTAVPAWNLFARAIAASFLLIVGIGLVLAQGAGLRRRAFLRRLARLGLAAGLVTLATLAVFPESFIFFGILHNIALSSILALPFLRPPALVPALAGLAVLAAPALVGRHDAFDAPALAFLGLGSTAPLTNDFVPVFPWTGFVLLGVALARAAGSRVAAPGAPPGRPLRVLAALGRHSLAIYLLHQPAIFGALSGVAALTGPNPAAVAAPFLRQCRTSCEAAGQGAALCQASCACTAERFKSEGLWRSVVDRQPEAGQVGRMSDIARLCYEEAAAAAVSRPSPR